MRDSFKLEIRSHIWNFCRSTGIGSSACACMASKRNQIVPQFETYRRIDHSADDMFALVADVERYPEFVPLCEQLRVLKRVPQGDQEIVTATMTVAYKVLRESFTSRIVLDARAREIRVTYLDGPFRYLENVWSFRPLGETSCDVAFRISYEFRSRILAALMGAAFDRAFRKFASAFEERADQIYGRTGGQGRAAQATPGPAVKASPPAEAS
jgi:coenzyme Q-binding protein COQ10